MMCGKGWKVYENRHGYIGMVEYEYMQIICPCGNTKEVIPSRFERTKYCSKKCFYKYRPKTGFKKGHPVYKGCEKGWFKKRETPPSYVKLREWWNKPENKKKMSEQRKGKRVSIETEFKKEDVAGEKNVNWKGDKVGYSGLHTWLQRNYGKAEKCSKCGSNKNVQWANISGDYKRIISDWRQLCVVCHRRFDGITKLSRFQANEIRERHKSGEMQKELAREFGVDQATISNLVNNKIKYHV